MTDWTPKTNRIQTRNLTQDEHSALYAAAVTNGVLYLSPSAGEWMDAGKSEDGKFYFSSGTVYRAKPAPVTRDVVPWEATRENVMALIGEYLAEVDRLQQRPQPAIHIDLEKVSWRMLCEAAAKSKWIPPEYFTNDWLSDCCDFLENGHHPAATGAVTEPLAEGAQYWVAEPTSPQWAYQLPWNDDATDHRNLLRGLIHITEAAAVAAAKAHDGRCVMEWQPIETAPTDGKSILVGGGEFLDQSETYPHRQPLVGPVIAYFIEFEGWFIGNSETYGECLIAFPTHWMPLPTNPEATP